MSGIIPPKVCIVILNWNGWEDTVECLRSLRKVTYGNFHIILIDNGSTDGSIQNLTPHPNSNIFFFQNNNNLGFAKGCNQGMRYAIEEMNADWILLLNSDTRVEPDFLTEMLSHRWDGVKDTVKILNKKDWVGMIQPFMLRMNDPRTIDSTGHIISWGQVHDRLSGKRATRCNSLGLIGCSGAAGLYRVEMIKDIGFLDEKYDTGYEDSEYSWRAYKSGWKTAYAPDAIVYHKRSVSIYSRMKTDPDFTRNLFINAARPCKTHGSALQKIQICAYAVFFGIKSWAGQSLGRNTVGANPSILLLKEMFR